MVLLAIFLAAAVCLVGGLSYGAAKRELTESVNTTLVAVADAAAQEIADQNEKEFAMLHALAGLPYFTDPDVTLEEKNAQLQGVIKNNRTKYENLAYYDETGMSIIGTGEYHDFSEASYFVGVKGGKDFLSDPKENSITTEVLMFYSVPIFDANNRFAGAIVSIVRGNWLNQIVSKINVGKNSHPGVMNMKTGQTVGDANEGGHQGAGVDELDPNSDFAALVRTVLAGQTGTATFTDPFTHKKMASAYRPVGGGSDWAILCAAPYDDYFGGLHDMRIVIIVLLVIILVVATGLGYVFIASLLKPLGLVKRSITDIASGSADLTKRIEVTTHDEIGAVVEGFNLFTEKLQGIISGVKTSRDELGSAGKNLVSSTEDTGYSISEIIDNIDGIHSQIENQSKSVQQTAGAVNEIASNIESLEHMIENQSMGVSQASAAVEEMIGNISSVNVSVDKMVSSFEVLQANAAKGEAMKKTLQENVDEMGNQSKMLKDANTAIASIASQTNLLAMNAAIEAAHAGDAGRGFAVVADEIRKLSETSSQQSKTIGQQLKGIQSTIGTIVGVARGVGDAFNMLNSGIAETDVLVRQIKAAMSEQQEGSRQISDALHTMNDSTLEVRTASREMSEGNKAILEEVRALQEATGVMQSSMGEMRDSARKIDGNGATLSEISAQMKHSIEDIGTRIDEFKV